MIEEYELIVGLEVHAQLSTGSKAFSSDVALFGGEPNTYVNMVSLGHPGTLPYVNKQMVNYAVKLGLACNSVINTNNTFARKNYFYADLPKGYQITQDQQPICIGGNVPITLNDQSEKVIRLHHIHMEDDAGKSIHDQHDTLSLIDLNRAGTPLLEIVTEPDIRSSEQAAVFLQEIRKIVRFLDICDGNMEEGSLRCDANISIRKKGESIFNSRCEIKNLNSVRNVQRAIEYEYKRQIAVVSSGGTIEQTTLNFNADTGETSVLRTKEMANDYRYFPEPDLPPIQLSESFIEKIRLAMPPLPAQLRKKYTAKLDLSDYDASVLTADKETALFFEELITLTDNYKAAANWVMGALKSYLNAHGMSITQSGIKARVIADIIKLIDDGKLNSSNATGKLFPALATAPQKDAVELAKEMNLLIADNGIELSVYIDQALNTFPEKIKEYQKGKKGVLGLFMSEIMRSSKGKIDPKKVNQLLIKALDNA